MAREGAPRGRARVGTGVGRFGGADGLEGVDGFQGAFWFLVWGCFFRVAGGGRVSRRGGGGAGSRVRQREKSIQRDSLGGKEGDEAAHPAGKAVDDRRLGHGREGRREGEEERTARTARRRRPRNTERARRRTAPLATGGGGGGGKKSEGGQERLAIGWVPRSGAAGWLLFVCCCCRCVIGATRSNPFFGFLSVELTCQKSIGRFVIARCRAWVVRGERIVCLSVRGRLPPALLSGARRKRARPRRAVAPSRCRRIGVIGSGESPRPLSRHPQSLPRSIAPLALIQQVTPTHHPRSFPRRHPSFCPPVPPTPKKGLQLVAQKPSPPNP